MNFILVSTALHLPNADASTYTHHPHGKGAFNKKRFKSPGSRNEQNIAMPSESLHVANISEAAEETALAQLFSAFGVVVAFHYLPNTRKVCQMKRLPWPLPCGRVVYRKLPSREQSGT